MQIANVISNPVKVSVGVILVLLFGLISAFLMPMQLSPDVEQPVISISTTWPGASPQEIEKEIVNEQEEQLKSVSGITRMLSESSDSRGEITLEFQVGTNMDEAVLKVNSQLQQVREYPLDAEKPVIRTSGNSDRAIAWYILSARPPSLEELDAFAAEYPEHKTRVESIKAAYRSNVGLATLRLRAFAEEHPEASAILPPDVDVPSLRKFAEDVLEAAFERVEGVANSDVRGGQERELQVIVDPARLAARGLTIADVTNVLRQANQDVSAGDFWEGKRRYVVRTLGQFKTLAEIEEQIVFSTDDTTVRIRDVADVRLGLKKPTGFVRRFGVSNIAVNVQRESGSNVISVMEGLDVVLERLNEGVLARKGLILTKVYDETVYINSAIGLVNQNIVLGSALTVIVLMMFLHLNRRSLIFVPLLAASAVLALTVSPWFFLLTLALILAAGFWFARGTLVVALAIPISVIGTFLILLALERTLNVISLAGLAFAVGMLVDNAVVVLENIYRFYQLGHSPWESARRGVNEVWGAVLASTLTTLFVFLPIVFLQGEAGQLFVDIALAISAAVGLSLIVSVLVIPTASSRVLSPRLRSEMESSESGAGQKNFWIGRLLESGGEQVKRAVLGVNHLTQRTLWTRVAVVVLLAAAAAGTVYLLLPEVEYLPSGNRNLIICRVLPPPGYNIQQLAEMGAEVEEELRPYWDVDDTQLAEADLEYPAIGDFFYVARSTSVFLGLRARDPSQARKLIDLIQDKLRDKFPGSIVVASQTSIFGRGLSGGKTIEVEIVGPELERLVSLGGQIMGQVRQEFPEKTQARPVPSLDLTSPEVHVRAKPVPASQLGVSNSDLGLTVNALIDGVYVGDYFDAGEKIDLVVLGSDQYESSTQSLANQYVATPNQLAPVRLDAFATVTPGAGPQQINHSERSRTITIEITPPDEISLESAINTIQQRIVGPIEESGQLDGGYQILLSGTADKLAQTWTALKWNLALAILITYLLMAALFESFTYPLVIILSVPLGGVGGILGLQVLNAYLAFLGEPPQTLDVLTMLGFVILVGTVVNNAILIVHQALNVMREEGQPARSAVLQSVSTRIRPIFMTTATTVFGLSPLVFFPGAGSELYRGLGSVVLGGLVVSTLFTLVLIPTLFTLMVDAQRKLGAVLGLVDSGHPEQLPVADANEPSGYGKSNPALPAPPASLIPESANGNGNTPGGVVGHGLSPRPGANGNDTDSRLPEVAPDSAAVDRQDGDSVAAVGPVEADAISGRADS